MRQRLLPAHARHGLDRDARGVGGLLDRTGQQGVRGGLAEHPVSVVQGGLDRRREAHRLPQVVDPVTGVEGGSGARILKGRRVIRHLRFPRNQVGECSGQVGEDGVDLRRVRGDVDGHLAGHHVDGLPCGHQFTDRIGRAADDGGRR